MAEAPPDYDVFISAVTSEFEQERIEIARWLARQGLHVSTQETFNLRPGTLWEKLRHETARCQAAVCLMGAGSGAFPEGGVPEGSPARSFTQWEFWLACDGFQANKRPEGVYVFFPKDLADRQTMARTAAGDDALRLAALDSQERHVRDVQATGIYYAEFADLHDLVKQCMALPLRIPPGSHKPNNLPYATLGSLFKGREEFLAQIRETLGEVSKSGHRRAAAITGSAQTAALYGLGGIGKTRAAIEYARANVDEFTALLFVRADSPENLQSNLAALCAADVLNLPAREERETEVRVAAVLLWLEAHPGWFLILDNVDSEEAATAVEDLLGHLSPDGQVLITSRLSNWMGGVEPLALDLLTMDASVDYLLEAAFKRRKTGTDARDARILAETLGQLPLALTQAAAYINRSRLTLARYLEEWRAHRAEVQGWFDERQMKYPVSVAVTWQASVDQLTTPARDLLNVLSCLAPDPIPESLLDVEAPGIDDGAIIAPAEMQDSLAELESYCLITRDGDRPEFAVHRLVQEVTRSRMGVGEAKAVLGRANAWIAAAFEGDPQDVRTWATLDPLAPHASTVTAAAASEAGPDVTRIMNILGVLYTQKANYHSAEQMFRRALEIDERAEPPRIAAVARDLNDLGALFATLRPQEAEPLYRRAVALRETLGQDGLLDLAESLQNLGSVVRSAADYTEAEMLLR
jgi:tetratricopeptide (TPR) repeat protein